MLLPTNMLTVPNRRDSLMTTIKQLLAMIGLISFVFAVCVVVPWDESDSAAKRNLLEGQIGGGCKLMGCDAKKGLVCNTDKKCEIDKVQSGGDCKDKAALVSEQKKDPLKGLSQICADATDSCGWKSFGNGGTEWICCKTKDHKAPVSECQL